ncbi:MAG: type II secretion system F family protein [Myxococcaceae bacterium]|jgi:type IV pilus assembly protein PilC|nr:type II secretion system F family protein [Myxococcaceae bacterium]
MLAADWWASVSARGVCLSSNAQAVHASAWTRNLVSRWRRTRAQEVVFRQLHALTRAGIALPTAFVQLRTYAPNDATARAFSAIAGSVAKGSTLGDALREHLDVFEPEQVELLSAAEQAGSLDAVLHALAAHLEAVRRLRWKAFLMMLWPAYLVGVLVFLGPLVDSSASVSSLDGLVGSWLAGVARRLVLVGFAGVAVALAPVAVAVLGLERPVDALLLQVPGVGGALRGLAASRALLTLGLALSAGLEVARAVRAALLSTARASLVVHAEPVVARVRAGSTLTEALAPVGLFDRETLGQLAIAETTGTLDETLTRLGPEVSERGLRAVRTLVIVVAALVAAGALLLLVRSLLSALFGNIKTYYDTLGGSS